MDSLDLDLLNVKLSCDPLNSKERALLPLGDMRVSTKEASWLGSLDEAKKDTIILPRSTLGLQLELIEGTSESRACSKACFKLGTIIGKYQSVEIFVISDNNSHSEDLVTFNSD